MVESSLTEEQVRAALARVPYPGLKRDIVSLRLVRSVAVRNGRVHVSLVLSTTREDVPDLLRAAIRERLAEAGAVRTEVQIVPPERRGGKLDPWADRARLPGVKRVVAVGAGKGGVGKSTVAANLALALHGLNLRTGLMDADIYGPSLPVIMGIEDGARHVRLTDDRKIIPLEIHGLSIVSFGFFLGPQSPAVWRGPMVGKAVKQFSRGVVWPELDVLVVDLPPGTGDVPLSLAQSIVVDGAVVVTTPQRLATLEAGKALEMFRKLDVPVLGIVENMSFAQCACGRRSHPFGAGGGERLAAAADVPLLAAVPFEEPVVEGEDAGAPPVLAAPDSGTARAFVTLAEEVASRLGGVQIETERAITRAAHAAVRRSHRGTAGHG
ncbi:MAG TPA: Mrp/NBP35 family ATP-binding protein [Longimicrobiales bacterium]|nr:Mrp/NBP35 family ATP-binding protein [Longimicrobiales bacterium]